MLSERRARDAVEGGIVLEQDREVTAAKMAKELKATYMLGGANE